MSIKEIEAALHQLTSTKAFEISRTISDFARFNFNSGNFPIAIALCERVLEIDDDFFSPQSLFLLAEIWRRLKRRDKEKETYVAIANLPAEKRKFVDPLQMGTAMTRAGHFDQAKSYYMEMVSLYMDPSNIEANLAELLLTMNEFKECIEWSSRVAAHPSIPKQIIGRLFRGSSFFLLGDKNRAEAEFRWLGGLLASIGSVPNDFAWDFGDSLTTLYRVDSAAGSLVIKLLSKQMEFSEFLTKWIALFPVQKEVPAAS